MHNFFDLTLGTYVHWKHDSEYKSFNTYGKIVGCGDLESFPPKPYVDILTYDDDKIHRLTAIQSGITVVTKDTVVRFFDLKLIELELKYKQDRNIILERMDTIQ